MALWATGVALAMAAVLLRAALEKARNPAPMAVTLRRLGIGPGVAGPAALVLTAAELVVALAVLFRPDSVATQIGLVSLAGLFALAGLIALGRDQSIPCSCFGAGGRGDLGVTQLIAFLPWLAGVWILRLGIETPPSLQTGAAGFAAASLIVAAVPGIRVWQARRAARGDRRSAQEMYVWLPSR